ncbi:putative bifunctional diguanylate cyclase/phosphodiesterase [Agaribacterium haliotis]|uniref:putative bifunctional diguanylate cyclase/phosphodiesterase n=1 Tax=Agaribacterium haliotis TaxID=2013869 RepID=UPI000BB55DC1|nr:bifunctional diguanylate cyclase/phosphodiesterase [Agaribacterium haliotis]
MTITNARIHWQAWGVVSCLAVLLVSLAFFAYLAAERSQAELRRFNHSELPLFDEIQKLRTAIVSVESSVYEYYLTADARAFQARYRTRQADLENSLAALSSVLGADPELAELVQINAEMAEVASVFAGVMRDSPIDWDAAREVLSWFSPLIARANAASTALTEQVRRRVEQNSTSFASNMGKTVYLVAGVALFSVLAGAWLALSNQRRLEALKEQQRLASFPRSNPHPVISLNRQGEIMYANEAASIVALNAQLDSLLPEDLPEYLDENPNYREWEFEKGGRHLQISLGWLPEYCEYHAYLSDITARKHAEQDLAYLAYHDVTTGLINRQQFNEFVDQYLQQKHIDILVAILDVDLLDTVMAAAGVAVAEKIARLAAMRLQHSVTGEDNFKHSCLSYLGGGLFCFAYPDDGNGAAHVFERMQLSFTRPFDVDGYEFYLKLRIGVVDSSYLSEANSEEALRLADGALNQTKGKEAALIAYYERGIEERHRFRVEVESGLRHAIERNELSLYYQPKVSLLEGRITGAEALIRWNRSGQWISPADFIPIAEDSGQILEVGSWVLEQVCKQAAKWNRQSASPLELAINVSAKQLLHTDLCSAVLAALKRNDMPVEWIELEITETAALTDFEHALLRLHELRRHGIKLSLDDFGTGYSSLSYLQRLPVQTLKIDQSFIRSLQPGSKDEALASTMVELAHQMEIAVVAEGVETDEQLRMLHHWHCEYIQGYLVSAPLAADAFWDFWQSFNASQGAMLKIGT